MKVLLIFPPRFSKDKGISNIDFPPIGLVYISTFLKNNGYSVELVDMAGYSWQKVEHFLSGANADMVGISCWTGTHFNSFQVAKLVKKYMKNDPLVILGGPHATAKDEEIVRFNPSIDIVVRGEGELTTHKILEYLEGKRNLTEINGITYRGDNGQTIRNPDAELIEDLDSLPFPDYSDLELSRYKDPGFYEDYPVVEHPDLKKCKDILFASICTSRGCPNRCQFCFTIWPKLRLRSAENIVKEIECLYNKGIRHFVFIDDTFMFPLDRAERICELIIEKGLKIYWRGGTRAWPINERAIQLMKDSGCQRLGIGVESGSPKILNTIGKGVTVDQIKQAYKIFNKVEISAYALLMVGNPGETTETVNETIRLIKECRPQGIIVAPLVIYPNTGVYRLAVEKKFIAEDFWVKNGTIPCYTVEHSFSRLRYFRFKILLHYYIQIGKINSIIKYLMFSIAMYILSALGLGRKNK